MRYRNLIFILLTLTLFHCQGPGNNNYTENEDIARKVDSLLNLMTLEEKIGQMTQYSGTMAETGPSVGNADRVAEIESGRVGSMLNITGPDATRKAQELALRSRLKIPMLFGYDVIHGFRTIFPIPLGEAASFDLDAIESSARVAAVEASAAGVHWTFAPMVDIARDPRWGRIMEGAGEDPYYGAQVAGARVKGFQGDDLSDPATVIACAKHYVAYGAAESGKDYNTVDMSRMRLFNVYLPPFKAALNAHVRTFMNSFNDFDGVPATGNTYLIRNILKGRWDFNGFVVSDYNSVAEMVPHGFAADQKDAAKKAVIAGCDMEMVSGTYQLFLPELVRSGEINENLIDDAVRRILTVKYELGLFDDPFKYCNPAREKSVTLSQEHKEIAENVAKRSIVLLKNENKTLPLSKDTRTIAVIGPLADSQIDMNGEWFGRGRPEDVKTLLASLRERYADHVNILYARGCDVNSTDKSKFGIAMSIARQADVVIAAVGESWAMTGEAHSRSSLELPGVQLDLLKLLQSTGKPIVVTLMNGRPLSIRWVKDNVPAILECWFLGTAAGDAITDVLFGDYNPSGKLPVSFPYSVGQVPVFYNHRNTGRPVDPDVRWTSKYIDIPNDPLFPFGFGLSYTSFEYKNLQISAEKIKKSDSLNISMDVTNTGEVGGEEVVQLYIRDLVASITRPVLELKGFHKIRLEPGDTRNIKFTIHPRDLGFYNNNLEFLVEPGTFKVFVGSSSGDIRLQGQFDLQ